MRYCAKHDRMFDEFAPCQGCAAAALGRLGGKAGRGEAKRRGDSAYYKALRAKRRAKIAKAGQCDGGCTFWQCGREMGHPGPCAP